MPDEDVERRSLSLRIVLMTALAKSIALSMRPLFSSWRATIGSVGLSLRAAVYFSASALTSSVLLRTTSELEQIELGGLIFDWAVLPNFLRFFGRL